MGFIRCPMVTAAPHGFVYSLKCEWRGIVMTGEAQGGDAGRYHLLCSFARLSTHHSASHTDTPRTKKKRERKENATERENRNILLSKSWTERVAHTRDSSVIGDGSTPDGLGVCNCDWHCDWHCDGVWDGSSGHRDGVRERGGDGYGECAWDGGQSPKASTELATILGQAYCPTHGGRE